MKISKDIFPFEYKGGGYFRHIDVPEGKSAEMLHGMEAVEYLYQKMTEETEKTEEKPIAIPECLTHDPPTYEDTIEITRMFGGKR